MNHPELTELVKVYASEGAFAGLKEDGSALAWGPCAYGGCERDIPQLLHVVAAPMVFVGLTRYMHSSFQLSDDIALSLLLLLRIGIGRSSLGDEVWLEEIFHPILRSKAVACLLVCLHD